MPEPLASVPPSQAARLGARGSPAEALATAFHDTLRLLFRPFDARRWFTLSLVCLLLGGGAPSAALNWSLGALRSDAGVAGWIDRTHQYASHHLWLAILAIALGLGLALAVTYLRAVLRFVLVAAIIDRGVFVGPIWTDVRSLGNSYFLWFMALLAGVMAALAACLAITVRSLRSAEGSAAASSVRLSIVTVTMLAVVVLGGLLVGIVVTLTDDLVVPVMFAENLKLLPAWRKLGGALRAEAGAFALYLVLRFTASLLVGAFLLLFLFPAVLSLFSGAAIGGAVIVFALRMAGLHWVWNPLTMALAGAAVLVLTLIVLVFLSVVGMPGQVLLQDFGIHFAAPRFPSLESRCRSPLLRRAAGWKSAQKERYNT